MNKNVTEFIDTQEWVPIHTLPSFEPCIEYYINRKGQVRTTKGGQDKLMVPVTTANGYKQVGLQQRIGQKGQRSVLIHTLVALAFIGLPPTPMGRRQGCSVVDHIDEDKTNNNVKNLHWISVKDNICKKPYAKFQKKVLTLEQEEERLKRKRHKAKLRQQKYRKRLKEKAVKIEECNDEN